VSSSEEEDEGSDREPAGARRVFVPVSVRSPFVGATPTASRPVHPYYAATSAKLHSTTSSSARAAVVSPQQQQHADLLDLMSVPPAKSRLAALAPSSAVATSSLHPHYASYQQSLQRPASSASSSSPLQAQLQWRALPSTAGASHGFGAYRCDRDRERDRERNRDRESEYGASRSTGFGTASNLRVTGSMEELPSPLLSPLASPASSSSSSFASRLLARYPWLDELLDSPVIAVVVVGAVATLVVGMWQETLALVAFTGGEMGGLGFAELEIGILLSVMALLVVFVDAFAYRPIMRLVGLVGILRLCLLFAIALFMSLPALNHLVAHMVSSTTPYPVYDPEHNANGESSDNMEGESDSEGEGDTSRDARRLWASLAALMLLHALVLTFVYAALGRLLHNAASPTARQAIRNAGVVVMSIARILAPVLGGCLWSWSISYSFSGHHYTMYALMSFGALLALSVSLTLPRSLNASWQQRQATTLRRMLAASKTRAALPYDYHHSHDHPHHATSTAAEFSAVAEEDEEQQSHTSQSLLAVPPVMHRLLLLDRDLTDQASHLYPHLHTAQEARFGYGYERRSSYGRPGQGHHSHYHPQSYEEGLHERATLLPAASTYLALNSRQRSNSRTISGGRDRSYPYRHIYSSNSPRRSPYRHAVADPTGANLTALRSRMSSPAVSSTQPAYGSLSNYQSQATMPPNVAVGPYRSNSLLSTMTHSSSAKSSPYLPRSEQH